jgi:hypothetical protein
VRVAARQLQHWYRSLDQLLAHKAQIALVQEAPSNQPGVRVFVFVAALAFLLHRASEKKLKPARLDLPIPCVGPQPPDDVCPREHRQLARWERIVT